MSQATHTKASSPYRSISILDSLGRRQSLASGAKAFLWEKAAQAEQHNSLLVLGLGPEPKALPAMLAGHYTSILWVECPQFENALSLASGISVPLDPSPPETIATVPWLRISPEEAVQRSVQCDMALYRQNLRLFPEFWGPLWARIQCLKWGLPVFASPNATVALLGQENSLLIRELTHGFRQCGFDVHVLSHDLSSSTSTSNIQHLLRHIRPSLFFSVNGHGLDAGGEIFHLLHACGVPVALWFVDNPWHILTRFRLPWWRQLQLFCTDASFLPGLRAAGAQSVEHLPLAVAPHMWDAVPYANTQAKDIPGGPLEQILFVGRLAFPQKNAFFGAARVPASVMNAAQNLQDAGKRPDFAWWSKALDSPPEHLWPGHAVRAVGLGAESCAARNRLQWMAAARPHGLTHYGHMPDDPPLPELPLAVAPQGNTQAPFVSRPPVDYYSTLPRLYATAPYTLNVTSLLLPQGLTQRHFDVWAGGGFLLTDASPGLNIFPKELTAEICVQNPKELTERLKHLEAQPALRTQVQQAWKKHLLAHHSYTHRVHTLCQQMHISPQIRHKT